MSAIAILVPAEADRPDPYNKAKYIPDGLEHTDRASSALADDVLGTISNLRRRKTLRAACDNEGLRLLIDLKTLDTAKTSSGVCQRATEDLTDLVVRGLADHTCLAFDEYSDAYERFNKQQQQPFPDAVVASAYASAVKALGDMIETKLELQMMQTSAYGDLDLTLAAIDKVLTDLDAKSSKRGGALVGGAKPGPYGGDRPPPVLIHANGSTANASMCAAPTMPARARSTAATIS